MKKKVTTSKPLTLPEDLEELKALALQLHADLEERTQQRDNLSKLSKQLSADIDALEDEANIERERDLRAIRIRAQWRSVTDGYCKSVKRLLGELPLSTDTEVFESDDWDRLSGVLALTSRFMSELRHIQKYTFVEASE